MSQTSLRIRIVPRYPGNVTATDGLKTVRSGLDVIVKSDHGSLVQVPTVTNPDRTFMLAWDADIDNYQSMSFTNIINNVQDTVIGPPLAAIDAANPGADQVFISPASERLPLTLLRISFGAFRILPMDLHLLPPLVLSKRTPPMFSANPNQFLGRSRSRALVPPARPTAYSWERAETL
ncbi:hypothetical protein [Rhizobium sp. LEGMi135b]